MLTTLKKIRDIQLDEKVLTNFRIEDFVTWMEIVTVMKAKNMVETFDIWDINKRTNEDPDVFELLSSTPPLHRGWGCYLHVNFLENSDV
jgi:DNA integrity scanning protein DisA with diadenylate cyclase activity